MRSVRFVGLVLLFTFYLVSRVEASYTQAVSDKLGRGLGNVLSSPLEIPLQVSEELKGDDYVYALPKGLAKGTFYTVGRLVVGVYEIGTFVIPQDPILQDFNQG